MNKLYNESSVRNIADAIRSVNGSTDTYTIGEMAAAVSSISTGLDWAELGYDTTGSSKGTPKIIIDGFNYAKSIKENYTPGTSYEADTNLLYFPSVNIEDSSGFIGMFYNSTLEYIPPVTFPNAAYLSNTFRATRLTDITFGGTNLSLANTFNSCKFLKNVTINGTLTFCDQTFYGCNKLESITINDENLSDVTNMHGAFNACNVLVSAPLINTSNCTTFLDCFSNCNALVDVPAYNTGSVTDMRNCFSNCNNLSNDSLNNILAMCAGVPASYGQAKKLRGSNSLNMPNRYDAIWPTLSNYQAFIDAGWVIV